MSSEFESVAYCRERLSALADGELDAPGSGAACMEWRGDAELRRDWHAWHLIGDVLRSDDLACEAGRDLRLLAVVRERLASEPVVLAPSGLLAAAAGQVAAGQVTGVGQVAVAGQSRGIASRGARWRAPAAIAAGLVLAVGTVVVMRAPNPGTGSSPVVALADATALPATPDEAARSADPAARTAEAGGLLARVDTRGRLVPPPGLDRQMIRDARLDRYLDAHKQFAGSSALGLPSAFLSGATVDSSSR